MNKRTLRAFALGILFSAIILIASHYFPSVEAPSDLEQAKVMLEEQGYKVMTMDEFEKATAKTDEEKNIKEKESESKKPDVVEKEGNPEQKDTAPEAPLTYELVIEGGMNTGDVVQLLNEAKIIEDAASFEEYLVGHGYNTKLQIGTFELNAKMNYEEISKIITKTHK